MSKNNRYKGVNVYSFNYRMFFFVDGLFDNLSKLVV